jgi:predicted DNA-binding transcriptional regulator YafY
VEKLFDNAESEALLLALYSCPTLSCSTLNTVKEKLSPFLTDADLWVNVKPSATEQEPYEFTYNLRVIFIAMRDRKMINFPYVSHRIGGKAAFERDIMGVVRDHLVKPLFLTCFEGRVYLYGEIGDTDKMLYFALDKIHEPRITDIGFAPKESYVKTPSKRLERKKPSGELSERAVILCDDNILAEIYDAFDDSLHVLSAYNGKTELEICIPYEILIPFILRFGSKIEALAPTKLRRAVSNELHRAANKYRFQSKLRGSLSDIIIKK